MNHFLTAERLKNGPWQAFERDVARLLMHAEFDEVRVVGGTGDGGADVVGVKNGEVWIVQCKHTKNGPALRSAVSEVVNARTYYGASHLVLATSRPVSPSVMAEVERYRNDGINVDLLYPENLNFLAEEVPEYTMARRDLRPYQQEAADKFREGLIDLKRAQIVMATGLGKTVVMAEVVADMYENGLIPYNRVLVLADRVELVKQLQIGFWHQLPKWIPTHLLTGNETPTFYDGITFATVQSIGSRLNNLPRFGLILVDEAHHIGSKSFQDAIDTLDPPMIGGATATPWRGDGFDISKFLGSPLVTLGISDGLREKYLCEVDYMLLADNIDWQEIPKLSSHRYSIKQLNRQLLIPTRDDVAARHICEVFINQSRHSGIVFSPTIEHAKSFAGRLRHYDIRVEAISSDLSNRERDKLMTMFRKGDIDILTSVDMFNEGIDVPDVDLVVFMRATHSRRIFIQQIGRGLRLSHGKDKVIVMDFVSDIRRISEVIHLEKSAKGPIETLPLGEKIVYFRNDSAGSYMLEWLKDQANLSARPDDSQLELPQFEFPAIPRTGSIQ